MWMYCIVLIQITGHTGIIKTFHQYGMKEAEVSLRGCRKKCVTSNWGVCVSSNRGGAVLSGMEAVVDSSQKE